MEVSSSSAADWAQFAATVIGLAVAIAVPAVLHQRETRERRVERNARARTHAIQLLAPLESLWNRLDKLRRDPGADVRGLAESIAAMGTSDRGPDSLPKKIDYLDEQLVQPFFKGIVFHEMGDAAEALQVFFNDWQQLTSEATYQRLASAAKFDVGSRPEELLARLEHATDLLKKAVRSMNQLFPGGYKATRRSA